MRPLLAQQQTSLGSVGTSAYCHVRRALGQTRLQLLEECQYIMALQLTADKHLAFRVDAVNLKYRRRNIETDSCDRLHDWLL